MIDLGGVIGEGPHIGEGSAYIGSTISTYSVTHLRVIVKPTGRLGKLPPSHTRTRHRACAVRLCRWLESSAPVHDGGHERQWCSAWGASAASGMVPAGTGCGLGGPGRDQVSQSDRFRARQDKVARAVDPDQIRTLTRVARLYYERGMRQSQIAQMLGMSQTRVSRLLSRAAEVGIVRMSVVTPPGVHAELEENLEARFGPRSAPRGLLTLSLT